MGVWEKGSKNNRLHFHCFINVPDNYDMKFENRKEYNFITKEEIEINVSLEFEDKFGRNDFTPIENQHDANFIKEIEYMMKYITKQSDKVVYSRGLKDKLLVLADFDNNALLPLKEDSTYFIMSTSFIEDSIEIDKNYNLIVND